MKGAKWLLSLSLLKKLHENYYRKSKTQFIFIVIVSEAKAITDLIYRIQTAVEESLLAVDSLVFVKVLGDLLTGSSESHLAQKQLSKYAEGQSYEEETRTRCPKANLAAGDEDVLAAARAHSITRDKKGSVGSSVQVQMPPCWEERFCKQCCPKLRQKIETSRWKNVT